METPETLPVKVKITGDQAGLKKISGDFMGLAGDLAEPMILMAAGATKVEVAWSAVRGVLEAKVLGPLSVVAGASMSALIGIAKLAKGFAEFGMGAAANLQSVETRFKAVLRSQELAGERIKKNVEIAKATPYSQDEVMEANRALEILSQGALATTEKMVMIGDATATAGEEFSNVAKWTGRLYDALQSGSPIGEASMRLQEMGIITGQTRRTLESMTESGASFSEMWGVVEAQMKKSEGAMKDLSKNLEGLQSTYADTMNVMKAKFAAGFLEGESARIEATTKVMEALTPTVETLGKFFGSASNKIENFKAKVTETVTSLPGFSSAATALSVAVTGLLAAFAAGSAASLLKFAATVIATTIAQNRMTKSTGLLVVAENLQVAATTQLTAANAALAASLQAVQAGQMKVAAQNLRVAATHTLTAAKTSGATVASVILTKGYKGLSVAMTFLGNAAKTMLASLIANPLFLMAAAVMAVGGALIYWNQQMKEARARAEAFVKTTNDLVSGLQAQQRAIATTTDLMKAHNNAVSQLADARRALMEAEENGTKKDVENASKRVAAMEKELEAINKFDRAKLALTDEQKQERREKADEPERLRQVARDEARQKMTPQELARDMQKEADEAQERYDRALREKQEQQSVQTKQNVASRSTTEASSELSVEEARLKQIKDAREKAMKSMEANIRAGRGAIMNSDYGEFDPKLIESVEDYKARVDQAEQEVAAKVDSLRRKVFDTRAGLQEALAGNSEIEKLKARTSLRNQTTEQQTTVNNLRTEIDNAGAEVEAEKVQELEKQERILNTLLDLGKKYNVELNQGDQTRDETDLETLKERLKREADAVALAEKQAAARKAADDAAMVAITERVEVEKTIVGIQALGLAGDLRAIDLERQKLDAALRRKKIGQEEYDQKMRILAAEEEAAKLKAGDRVQDAVTDTRVTQLRLEEEAARRIGGHRRRDRGPEESRGA
jgi:hypothetical protein